MAINFPSNPTNAQEVTEGNVTYVYNATKGYWESSEVSSGGASIDVLADMAALIAKTGMSNGDQAFVTGNNNLYIYSGSGWYKVATVQNDAPSAITGVNGSYSLESDGTATTITAVSTDPEGFPLTWSYSTSGLGSIATVSQTENVFTITPSTTEADAGTFSLTINATDGVNGAVSTSTNLTLEFIVIIANSKHTTLLTTATDTSDNNNITDSSSNNHSITVSGDAHAGTFSPYRSGGYSLEFNGSNSRVGIQSSDVQIGTSAFSMEFWLYSRAHSGSISSKYSSSNSNGYFLISTTTSEGFRCRTRSSGGTQKYVNSGSGTYNLNQWNHCIFQRDAAGNLTSYLNGTKYTGENDGSTNLSATELGLGVFNYIGYEGWLDGYIRDFKLTIGTSALRTDSTITVPTEPLTSDSNTTAFLCHLPYLADGSSSPNSVVSSNASTSPFSPYDYLEYSAADHGGSVYFDGTTDYLLINSPPTLGANDWTFETWYYSASVPLVSHNVLLSQGLGNNTLVSSFSISNTGEIWIQTYTTTNVVLYNTAAGIINGGMWNHIVLTHDYDGSNGGTYKIYANGNQVGNVSYTSGYYWNSGGISGTPLAMAQYRYNTQANSACYFSDWKISNSVTYSSDFIPPTAPLSSSGAELHIKGTDASIIDKSQGTNLKLVGNTTGSTTTNFTGAKSMYFDGTGDYAQLPVGSLHLGSSDFTIETWIYQDTNAGSGGSSHVIYSDWINTNNNKSILLRITDSSGQKVQLLYSTDGTTNIIYTSTSGISNSTWTHVAVCKDSTSLRLYTDGVEEIWENNPTFTLNPNAGTIGPLIGGNYDEALTSYGQFFDGYIQDFRITKGYARYTANFTPPTEPLEG